MAGTGRNTFWMHHRFSRRYRADDPGGQKRFHSQEGTDQNCEIYPCLLCGVLPWNSYDGTGNVYLLR